ncbi:MAG TPA: alpha/beta hydrolase [Candidatus Limnocylindrales bacterium]|nr:alpha/beta hydrolase [Candidatus Limnocylindrales bacterium]
MPHATANDFTRLYYEETGIGTPILFLHEFAGDHRSWEPQVRYFSRRNRCITYAARGYRPSDIPDSQEAYTFEVFRDDAVAVLDHVGVSKAHLVGLSMGGYSALQIGLRRPERVLSLTLAGTGSGSQPEHQADFRTVARATADQFEALGSGAVANTFGSGPNRVPFLVKDPRGFGEFLDAFASHDAPGSARTMRGVQAGRPSIYDFEADLRRLLLPTLVICGDEDDACLKPSLFLKATIPASGLVMLPKTGHLVNLEEPALLNGALKRFLALAEAGRWVARDPRSIAQSG